MRPSRDVTLMGVAQLWSAHSTCSRLPVGAVISRDGRSFSTGFNGAPARLPHCDHSTCILDPYGRMKDTDCGQADCPMHGPCRTAVHAELNAISFAAKYGLATDLAELHTTHQPCLNCAMAIINAGIGRVVYEHPYRDNGGLDLLIAAGVTAHRLIR